MKPLALTITSIDQSVRDDVTALKRWPFLPPGALIVGYVFDIGKGTLVAVDGAT